MIQNFLQSLAATVRELVRTGKAVHVTSETAAECELLAGLPWVHAHLKYMPCKWKPDAKQCYWCRTEKRITPADIALGWLVASRVGGNAEYFPGMGGQHASRAAECAELAVIAASDIAIDPSDGMWSRKSAHETGTREGARAAWGFVANGPLFIEDAIPLMRSMNMLAHQFAAFAQSVADRYRRELEAM